MSRRLLMGLPRGRKSQGRPGNRGGEERASSASDAITERGRRAERKLEDESHSRLVWEKPWESMDREKLLIASKGENRSRSRKWESGTRTSRQPQGRSRRWGDHREASDPAGGLEAGWWRCLRITEGDVAAVGALVP